jgi:hypothetical protein
LPIDRNPTRKEKRMIGSIARSLVALVLGFVAALCFIVAVEGVCAALYPFPEGVDPSDLEVCKAHVAQLPAAAFLIAIVGWGLAMLAGSWLATRLGTARHPAHGVVVGSTLFAAAVANMLMLPYPAWFWIGNLLVLPASLYWGTSLGRGRSSPAPPPTP